MSSEEKWWTEFIVTLGAFLGACLIAFYVTVQRDEARKERDEAERRAALIEEGFICARLPERNEIAHMAKKLDNSGYDCSITSWRDGQWSIDRTVSK